ncbi:MAG: hypothetical protein ACRD9L_26055, partial [Bryobacteraceae bacterium]
MTSPRDAWKRLESASRLLRERVNGLESENAPRSAAARWLQDNHAFLQFQTRELRRGLPPAYLRKLPKGSEQGAREPRIYRMAAEFVGGSEGVIDTEALAGFGATLRRNRELWVAELWAFGAVLKLAILERLCAALDSEACVALCITSLRALEKASWRDFVEAVSVVEHTLREDPAGIYPHMDFPTRDLYR